MLKIKSIMLNLGVISLLVGVMVERYVETVPIADFVIGFCFGFSLVMSVYSLVLHIKDAKKEI